MIRPSRRSLVFTGIAVWLLGLGAWMFYAHPTALVDSYVKCAEEGYPITETEPPTCVAGGRTFLGPRTSAAPAIPGITDALTGTAQPFEILVDGDSHGDYPNRQEVITNDLAWQQYWRDIHASVQPLPPLLPVDFLNYHVIALSEGQKPTGGYGLRVSIVTTNPKGTVVDVTESIPTITCSVTQSFTNRYFIVKTPKLTPPVSFRITTDHHRCK